MTRLLPLVLAGGGMVLSAGAARASLTIDHQSGADGCTEAATYFPEDDSPEALRARRRCRLETFERKMDDDRVQKAIEVQGQHDKLLESWVQKQNIPVRVFKRNAVDAYVSGGVTSYGLAVGGVLLPWLEGELWIGRRNVNGDTLDGYFQDSRTCGGGRFKWLMLGHGNLTPFASLGAAGCAANMAFTSYNYGPTTGVGPGGPVFVGTTFTNLAGSGVGHLVTGSAGLAWMDKSGLRASLEYVFAYAFYSQATLNDMGHTQDPTLQKEWDDRLASDRGGVRLQVGYAF
jgi:hypothetical protein